MTPLEVTVQTLREHQYDNCYCSCGWTLDGPVGESDHAAHVAGMLAAAGVLPTVQEWGVDGVGEVVIESDSDQERATQVAEYHAARRHFPGAHVVTRWATAWAPA